METAKGIKVCANLGFCLKLAAIILPALVALQSADAQTTYNVTDLGTLGGTMSAPNAINNQSAVGGYSTLAGDAVTRWFLWTGGSLIDLGSLAAGPNVLAQNPNSRSQIAGGADGAVTNHDGNACWCPVTSNLDCHSFIWQNGTMTDLGTMGGNSSFAQWMNNRGQVVGFSQINAIDPSKAEGWSNAICQDR